MSTSNLLTSVIASFPAASNLSSKNVLLADSSGNGLKGEISSFALRTGLTANVGSVLKIKNITSVLVSVRGSNGGRCALVWLSSYANGTKSRTSYAKLFNSDIYYEWYINGESDSNAYVYLKLKGTAGTENISVVSLAGEVPIIEQASLPSDATLINWGGVNQRFTISYVFGQKGGWHEYYNTAFQLSAEITVDRRDGTQRALRRFGGNCSARHLYSGFRNNLNYGKPASQLAIWCTGSDEEGFGYHSANHQHRNEARNRQNKEAWCLDAIQADAVGVARKEVAYV